MERTIETWPTKTTNHGILLFAVEQRNTNRQIPVLLLRKENSREASTIAKHLYQAIELFRCPTRYRALSFVSLGDSNVWRGWMRPAGHRTPIKILYLQSMYLGMTHLL